VKAKVKLSWAVVPSRRREVRAFFIEPTIITGQEETGKLMKEEIFGPVVAINVFKTEKEAIAKAVDSEFGLFFLALPGQFCTTNDDLTRFVLCRLF
jgi:acyl-CoA reductase-like NAD-dependent aldehyde dehydrogenase